jgi:serine protease inhibitor
VVVLPRESWLSSRVLCFLEYSHYPFLWFLNTAGPESMVGGILAVVVTGLCMALVWGGLLVGGSALLSWLLEAMKLSGRQKRLLGWGVAVLCVAGLGYLAADSFGDRPAAFAPSPAVKTLVGGNTALALDLYQKLRIGPGNVFFSPFGISTGLGLVYAGARGGTERELGRAAHFGLAQADVHPAFGELIGRMGDLQHGSRLTLVTANALWRQQGHPFSSDYLELARKRYRAATESADFKQAAGAATSRINAWVERQTRGRIKGMVEGGGLDHLTRLVLCDVLYFKGNWRSQFEVKKTCPAPFHVSTNETALVPMMIQEAEFKMARIGEPQATMLELPYYGGDLEMVIILPEAVDGLEEIENAITTENLNAWLARLDQASLNKTWVHLPRFTVRRSVELIPVLRSLGIVSAFDDTADLSGMDGTTNLFLGSALQRTFVEVNEAGTEAAAATLFEAKTKSMTGRFYADHPFLFLIRDRGSGTILFLGRLVDPRA